MTAGARRDRQAIAGWVMSGPALAAIALFFVLPATASLFLSFTDFDIYALADPANMRFVGLANYRRLIENPLFWKAVGNTAWFVVLGVPLVVALSLGAAMLVNARWLAWRPVWRAWSEHRPCRRRLRCPTLCLTDCRRQFWV